MIFTSVFFPNCTTYNPPLDVDCLNSIWRDIVGCTEDGWGYPGDLNKTQLIEEWGDKNQRCTSSFINSAKCSFEKTFL